MSRPDAFEREYDNDYYNDRAVYRPARDARDDVVNVGVWSAIAGMWVGYAIAGGVTAWWGWVAFVVLMVAFGLLAIFGARAAAANIDDTFIGTRVMVTTQDGETHVGGVSDVLRINPEDWHATNIRHASLLRKAYVPGRVSPADQVVMGVAGCLLCVGGKILVLTATSHVLAEATPTDGVS